MLMELYLRKMKWTVRNVMFLLTLTLAALGLGACGQEQEAKTSETNSETERSIEELTVWYTDPGIAAYMNAAAENYERETGIRIRLLEMSAIDYLENINRANIMEDETRADVYILNSNQLEKAYLAGLTTRTNEEYEGIADYPEAAVSACVWQGKSLGYPFYYETSFFLYNKNFVESCPAYFQEILDFSEQYGMDGTVFEGVETILKWDVRNLYYNYGFAGAYLNLGGPYGDEETVIDLTNESVVEALSFYKKLNQSLYFEAEESDYDRVLEEFLNGKILYTIAGTQSLPKLEEAYEAGFLYGIVPVLDMNETLVSKAVATNYLAEVNPYGVSEDAAEAFAVFLTDTYIGEFYDLTGKMSCKPMGSYPNPELAMVEAAYANSVQLPKLIKTSGYWMELELAFHAIWNAQIQYQSGEGSEEEDRENQIRMEEEIRAIVTEQMQKVQQQMELQMQE